MSGKKTNRKLALPFRSTDSKPYIFASYGHNDKEKVFPLIKKLYEAGYNVWYDEGIEINKAYDNVIAEHVRGCAAVVLFVSEHSVTRTYVVENELGYAVRCEKKILPLYLEDVAELPAGVDMLLHGDRFDSVEQIIEQLKALGIESFGAREAESYERDMPQSWISDEDGGEKDDGKPLVGCVETPYAYIGVHPEARSACRAYIKELYYAGYNVRSFEYSDERERMLALANKDCKAFVPVLTKKYVESGMLAADAELANSMGKPFIALLMESGIQLPPELDMTQGGKQMLNINEFTAVDFIAKLEDELKKQNCCILDESGQVERRSFIIPDFDEGVALAAGKVQREVFDLFVEVEEVASVVQINAVWKMVDGVLFENWVDGPAVGAAEQNDGVGHEVVSVSIHLHGDGVLVVCIPYGNAAAS